MSGSETSVAICVFLFPCELRVGDLGGDADIF
jgi:hypothetical protein